MRHSINTARFLLFIILGLAALSWLTQKPTSRAQAPISAEAQAYAAELPRLEVEDLLTQIQTSQRPTLLVLYASWCPYCRQHLPMMLEVQTAHEKRIEVIFASVDQQPGALAAYLLQAFPSAPFTPYVLANPPAMAAYIRASGGDFQGGIPYTALLDADGRVVAQRRGSVGRAGIEEMLGSSY